MGLFPLQMAFSWLINGGDPNYLRPSWDDPPSRSPIWIDQSFNRITHIHGERKHVAGGRFDLQDHGAMNAKPEF